MDLSRVKDRDRLKPQNKGEPHWQRIKPGCFLGFAPSQKGGDGAWHVRAYDPDTQRYRRRALGSFSELAGNLRFGAAKLIAEQYAEIVETGGQRDARLETVGDACREYAKSRPEAEQRFQRYLYKDEIAKVKLDRLRRRHLREWRQRLEAKPALVSRSKKGAKSTRKRAASTINRDMVPLRAALSKVLPAGNPSTEAAWQEALKPIPNANGQRTLYLDKGERGALLANIDDEALPFVKALCLVPLRPGALAALKVENFDPRTSELTIGKDKNGKSRRVKLARAAAELFSEQSKAKSPDETLFARANGKGWNKDSWKVPIAKAAAIAGLDKATSAYTLRHTTITDLVQAGLPLLTIAQISGTSAEMIEKNYGHLISAGAVDALETLSLST